MQLKIGEDHFNDMLAIKVASLNQIYSTAIQYISPVVDKIVENIQDK